MTSPSAKTVPTDTSMVVIIPYKTGDQADEALKKIQADLDWRGPNGHPMGHVVLKRELAEALMTRAIRLQALGIF